jgi:hypothetical protein
MKGENMINPDDDEETPTARDILIELDDIAHQSEDDAQRLEEIIEQIEEDKKED